MPLPFIIFSNVLLTEMAARLPMNDSNFLVTNSIGKFKLKTYVQQFLYAISEYKEEEKQKLNYAPRPIRNVLARFQHLKTLPIGRILLLNFFE